MLDREIFFEHMSAKERNELDDSDFALVYMENDKKIRKYPIHKEKYVKSASHLFPKGVPEKYLESTARAILRAAKSYGMDTSGWDSLNKYADKNVEEAYTDLPPLEILQRLYRFWTDCEYGIPKNNKIVDPDDVDFNKEWKLLSPDEFEKYKGGVCWDYVEYGEKYLKEHGFKCKKYFMSTNLPDNMTHTFLIADIGDDEALYYVEGAFKDVANNLKGPLMCNCGGNYEKAVHMVIDEMSKVLKDKFSYYVWEYKGHPPYGCNSETFTKYATKGEPIIEGEVKNNKPPRTNSVYLKGGNINKVKNYEFDKVYFGSPYAISNPMKLEGPLFVSPYPGIASIFAIRPQDLSAYGVPRGVRANRNFDEWNKTDGAHILKELHMYIETNPEIPIKPVTEMRAGYVYEINLTKELKDHLYRSERMHPEFEICIDKIDSVKFAKKTKVEIKTHISGRLLHIKESYMGVSDKTNVRYHCEKMIEILSEYKYGIPINGKITNVESSEYYDKHYKLLSPKEFEKYKGGICWDYVEWEEKYLKDKGIKCKKYFLYNDIETQDTHTFITVDYDGMILYPESSFSKYAGVREFNDVEELITNFLAPKVFSINGNDKKYDKIKYYVWEYKGHPPYGCNSETFTKYATKGEPIIEGEVKNNKSLFKESYSENDMIGKAKDIAKRIRSKVVKDRKPPTGNQNCQLCTWCAEANFRGYDVLPRAVYSPRDPVLNIKGERIVVNPIRVSVKSKQDLINKIKDTHDSRYYVHVNWNDSEGGHEFLILSYNGDLYIMDAQQGTVFNINNKQSSEYLDGVNYKNSYIVRLDNKTFNKHLLDSNNDESKILQWDEDADMKYLKDNGMIKESYGPNDDDTTGTSDFDDSFEDEEFYDESYKAPKKKYYRFTYMGEGIYEALKKVLYRKTKSDLAWKNFLKSNACSWLPKPPKYGDDMESYFTEKGKKEFINKTYPFITKHIHEPDIEISKHEIDPKDIVYSDTYQVVVSKDSSIVKDVKLKTATKKDLDKICEWQMETMNEKYRTKKYFDMFRKENEENLSSIKIISYNKKDIGMYQAYSIDEGEWWYIAEIYIMPEYRGHGIGSYLIKKDIDKHDKLVLRVDPSNKRAIKLYESLGFVTTKKEDGSNIMRLEKKHVQEGAWNDIKRGVNPWSKKLFFHLSYDPNLDEKELKPQIPAWLKELKDPEKTMKETGRYENYITPRVCLSPSIEGCLVAIMNTWKLGQSYIPGKQVYVYVPEKPITEYKHKTNKEIIKDGDIFDAIETKEMWILEPVKLKRYGSIIIDEVKDDGRRHPVIDKNGKKKKDDHIGRMDFKWHWFMHPSIQKEHEKYEKLERDNKNKE